MAIILEGMDNSGKSTLASKFGLEVLHPGPAPKTKVDELAFLDFHLKECRLPIVMDRVTCISQQVYQKRLFNDLHMSYLNKMINTQYCIIIYCRPPDEVILDFNNHNIKEYDTKEHIAKIKNNAKLYLDSYDKLMYNIPHLKYNYTIDNIDIAEILNTQFILGEWKRCLQLTQTLKHS